MKKKKSNLLWEPRFKAFDDALKRVLDKKRESSERIIFRPLYQEVLRCIFIVFVMLLDVFVILQVLLDVANPFGFVLFFIILLLALYFEMKIYYSIWSEKGYWSVERYRKKTVKK